MSVPQAEINVDPAVNHQFRRAVTNTAFNLTLTKTAIEEILFLQTAWLKHIAEGKFNCQYGIHFAKGFSNYMRSRGLIESSKIPGCQDNWILTAAGYAVAKTLRHAGFKCWLEMDVKSLLPEFTTFEEFESECYKQDPQIAHDFLNRRRKENGKRASQFMDQLNKQKHKEDCNGR